jgi:hypothetical protein
VKDRFRQNSGREISSGRTVGEISVQAEQYARYLFRQNSPGRKSLQAMERIAELSVLPEEKM